MQLQFDYLYPSSDIEAGRQAKLPIAVDWPSCRGRRGSTEDYPKIHGEQFNLKYNKNFE